MKELKLFCFNNYSNPVFIYARSKYEAFGLLMCVKKEDNSRQYYPGEDEIVEIIPFEDNTPAFIDFKTLQNVIKEYEDEQQAENGQKTR